MSKLFSVTDLLRICIKREHKSHHIYNEIIKATNSSEIKAFLEELIKEKKRHEEVYEKMLKDLDDYDNKLAMSHGNKDEDKYIDALVKDCMGIEEPSEEEIPDVDSVILYVINLDKRALDFFTRLKKHIEPELYDIIEKIYAEEFRHFESDTAAAIQYTANREKNSLLLYTCVQNYVTKQQQNEVRVLIREVAGFIEKLLRIRKSLLKVNKEM